MGREHTGNHEHPGPHLKCPFHHFFAPSKKCKLDDFTSAKSKKYSGVILVAELVEVLAAELVAGPLPLVAELVAELEAELVAE